MTLVLSNFILYISRLQLVESPAPKRYIKNASRSSAQTVEDRLPHVICALLLQYGNVEK